MIKRAMTPRVGHDRRLTRRDHVLLRFPAVSSRKSGDFCRFRCLHLLPLRCDSPYRLGKP